MNLEDSNKFVQENEARTRKKRFVLILIILCAILIAFLFVIIVFVKYEDGQQVSMPSDLFVDVTGTTYVNIKQITKLLGLTYTRGSYEDYTEDDENCYITSDHEIIDFTLGSSSFTKYILNSENDKEKQEEEAEIYGAALTVKSEDKSKEIFTDDNVIEQVNGNLYMPLTMLPDALNIQINTSEDYRIRIYTIESLYNSASKLAAKLSYTTITGTYENLRALVDGFIVVGNNGKYGVINTAGEEVISVKYDEIEFIQNVKEFFVYVDNNVGLLGNDGKTIIKPTEYDTISVFYSGDDAKKQLYEVTKNGKYGLLNRDGEVVIHTEYDQLGLQSNNSSDLDSVYNTLDNNLILFDECIPVKQNAKYGLFDREGNEVAKTVYDGIGYFVSTSSSSSSSNSSSELTEIVGESSVIIIPETTGIKGVVLNQNGKYGIYDVAAGRLIVPTVCSRIYSITKSGITTYYMEYNGMQLEVSSYMKDNDLVSVKNETKDTASTNNSVVPVSTTQESNVGETEQEYEDNGDAEEENEYDE
jgi:hypothetical protein